MKADEGLNLREIDLDDIDATNPVVDYYDGDIAILDNIHDLTNITPFYAKMNFVIICTKGNVEFEMNGKPITLYEDDLLLSSSNVAFNNNMTSFGFECKILCLSDSIINALLHDRIEQWIMSVYTKKTKVLKLPNEDKEQFLYYYELIRYKMAHKERQNQQLIMQSIVKAMLLDVCSMLDNQVYDNHVKISHTKVLFNRFLTLLSNNAVKRQPVEKYAYDLSITPKYLSYICTECSGKSPSDWIVQYTKEDIRYHLCHTDLSIKEVSDKLGFCNISHFGSYVRKHFGMSPKFVRQHEQKR